MCDSHGIPFPKGTLLSRLEQWRAQGLKRVDALKENVPDSFENGMFLEVGESLLSMLARWQW